MVDKTNHKLIGLTSFWHRKIDFLHTIQPLRAPLVRKLIPEDVSQSEIIRPIVLSLLNFILGPDLLFMYKFFGLLNVCVAVI